MTKTKTLNFLKKNSNRLGLLGDSLKKNLSGENLSMKKMRSKWSHFQKIMRVLSCISNLEAIRKAKLELLGLARLR